MIADLTPKESYDYSTSSMIFLTDPEGVECFFPQMKKRLHYLDLSGSAFNKAITAQLVAVAEINWLSS